MRGLRKSRPPADVSPDGQDARTLQEAEQLFLKSLKNAVDRVGHARATFDAMEKRKLRALMYLDQGQLCIYCERLVGEGHPAPRIDHWKPLSAEPELALHWRNLYLSCATDTTCDCRKRETRLCAEPGDADLPWPVDHKYERCVGFTSLGEAYVRTDAPLSDAQRKALTQALGVPHDNSVKDNGILNLNHPALVAARSAAVDSERSRLERDYKDKTATREERAALATQLIKNKPFRDFMSIRVRWLERSLGKAK